MKPTIFQPTPPSFPPAVFRPATEADIPLLASRLRPEIRQECLAAGIEPQASMHADLPRMQVFDGKDGQPYAAVMLADAGTSCTLWVAVCLGAGKHAPRFVSTFEKFCMELHGQYESIHSLVDARNLPTARLLTDAGFVFVKRFEKFGAEQRPFNLYTSNSKCANPYH